MATVKASGSRVWAGNSSSSTVPPADSQSSLRSGRHPKLGDIPKRPAVEEDSPVVDLNEIQNAATATNVEFSEDPERHMCLDMPENSEPQKRTEPSEDSGPNKTLDPPGDPGPPKRLDPPDDPGLSKRLYPPDKPGSSKSLALPVLPGRSKSVEPQEDPKNQSVVANFSVDLGVTQRPIYPDVPFSPYSSPRSARRRIPIKESRRVSIDQSGSFLQLNQYRILESIGKGSFSLVKLAYSEEDETHYAMKILSKRKIMKRAGIFRHNALNRVNPLDRVYREIAVLKKLDHPNVVKLIEVLDDPTEDHLYLVFELVEQGEILKIPTSSPLSESQTWKYFRDAVQGLEYLHFQRIIHRDIKPANLLLGEDERVQISDLGVCNEFAGPDATLSSSAGTPAFTAPEAVSDTPFSGKAADIWALGVTLFSLVYGDVPFTGDNIPALYHKILTQPLVFPPTIDISSELKHLITWMLQKDPALRSTLQQIKEHPWVTKHGLDPLASEIENGDLVEVTDDDVRKVCTSIPKLDTLILIKKMLKNHSFQNPFLSDTFIRKFHKNARSHSAPGSYEWQNRCTSTETSLTALNEASSSD